MSAREHHELIAALHERGLSFSELAFLFGTTRNAIAGLIYRAKHPRERTGPRPRRGEDSPTAKLTDSAVRDMRQRRAGGEKLRVLAEDYGVAISHVHCVVARKRWAHVA